MAINPQIKNVVQTDHGPRYAMEGDCFGSRVKVVTGYSILDDRWPFHVYMETGGEWKALTSKPTQFMANSQQSAFEQGMEMALQLLTPKTPPFHQSGH